MLGIYIHLKTLVGHILINQRKPFSMEREMSESRMLWWKKWGKSSERRIQAKCPQSLKLSCTFLPQFLYVRALNVSVGKSVSICQDNHFPQSKDRSSIVSEQRLPVLTRVSLTSRNTIFCISTRLGTANKACQGESAFEGFDFPTQTRLQRAQTAWYSCWLA